MYQPYGRVCCTARMYSCARWSSPGSASRSSSATCRCPRPLRARCCCASSRAASAAPTCTSSTASCRIRSCRSSPATRSSARPRTDAGSASRGSAGPCGDVPLLHDRPREPLRRRALHRLRPRRRLRRVRRRRRALLLPDPGRLSATSQAAPLLCAGLIGYRSLRIAGDAERLGLYGFGAAAHIVAQVARHQGRRVFALHAPRRRATRSAFALELGAEWAGGRTSARRRSSTRRSSSRRSARSCPPRSRALAKGGTRRLRRHPHERHPVVPVRAPLGGARRPLGREPHAPRRRGVPRARAAGAGPDGDRDLRARGRERGARTGCAAARFAARPSCGYRLSA